jgi:hypothetical protein
LPGAVAQVNGAARFEDLPRDQLIGLLAATGQGGIHIDSSGKTNARKLYRRA